ncbi:MAG TPA: AI-2E family transporter, partial [Patescibacteria group bacterium]|nr:AI-2E family transporter [Patescibacteria group bacterium]
MDNGRARRLRFEITWTTIFKVLIGVLIAFAAVKLWPVIQLLTISILLSVVLYRIVAWTCRKNWPRWTGIVLATMALLLVIASLFGLIIPMVSREASKLPTNLPKIQEQVLSRLPQNGPIGNLVHQGLDSATAADSQRMVGKGLAMLKATAGGLIDLVVVFALVIYMIVDGPRTLKWWIAFFPHEQRSRVSKGLEEIGARIVAYVTGQFIVSILFATYTSILLSILRVPMALLLGVLAGMVDILPIIGILIALVPAGLMALTVSPTTALIVSAAYLAYHGVEDYLIVPKVYGKKLKIS